jgi:uncharacterized membrane protein YkoI
MKPHLFLMLTLILGANLAWAADPAITLKKALEVAQTATPGKVLSNELTDKGGVQAYRVKILTKQSVVKTVFIDATKGELIK